MIAALHAALPAAGLVVWAIRFLAVYAVTALACERGWDRSVVTAMVLATAALGLALNGLIAVHGLRLARGPTNGALPVLGGIAAGIAALSSLAIVLEAIPALLIPICAAS